MAVLAGNRFQSPERIHAFGNDFFAFRMVTNERFNPQRGFMLLGTPDRLSLATACHCFSFNPQRGFMLLGTEPFHASAPMSRFNPQRGFMLLGTLNMCCILHQD